MPAKNRRHSGIVYNNSSDSLSSYGMSRNSSSNSLTNGEREFETSSNSTSFSIGDRRSLDQNNPGGEASWLTRRTTMRETENTFESESGEDLSEDSTRSSRLGNIATDWIIARDLVKALAKYPNSQATLLTLWEKHEFNPKSVRELTQCNNHIFIINGEIIDLRPDIAICTFHTTTDGCQNESTCEDLHICPQYLARNCSDEDCCPLGHKWDTLHNSKILANFSLQDLTTETLCDVIEYVITNPSPTGPLTICKNYNESACGKRYCKHLHICIYFVAGRAKCCRLECPLNHNFDEPSVLRLLETHGIAAKEAPKDIVKALHDANPDLSDGFPFPDADFPVTIWSTYATGDVEIPEICYNSVESKCEYERSGCNRLHCERFYHWQVKDLEGFWFNLTYDIVICLEMAYCNPSQDDVELPRQYFTDSDPTTADKLVPILGFEIWRANFSDETDGLTISSRGKVLQLRRLHSQDVPGEDIPGRVFLWYYQNAEGDFVEYGSKSQAGEDDVTDITSKCLESAFQNHLQTNSKIHFSDPKYTYYLDMNTMTQVNQSNNEKTQVRRRPKPHL